MLESGQELSARFVLVRRLGSGGSGSVWLAADRERNCLVAVKVLSEELMADVAAVAALRRECELARGLIHPNILRIDGLHQSARHAWIVMEYASGGDLSQLRGARCKAVLSAAIPVAAALAAAHRAGVIHRDVKPANVLLMADGTPRLTDFGIALATAALPAGYAGGSPCTMSPQQLDGAAAQAADDVYGFGALLYELLSGYPPFYPQATPERVRTEKPAALPSTVPVAVVNLVERCLAKSPLDRPADMQVVEQELKAALEALPGAADMKTDSEAAAPIRIEPPSLSASAGQGEPLRGEWRRSTGPAVSDAELRRQGFRRGIGAAMLSLGIVAVAVVFFVLPKWVEQEPPARYVQASSEVKPAPVEPEKKEVDLAALARAKLQAEEQRAAIAERLEKLRARAVDQWGGAEYQQVGEKLAAADKESEAREYVRATEQLAAIEPLLTTLEKRAGEALTAQLKAGAAALQDGRSSDAKAAFELAGKIDPQNQAAARGAKRAATLDEVLGLLAAAERLEKEGNMTGAAESFRKALALDAEAPRAADGLARIEARLAGDAFASAMARGFNALARKDYPAARTAFEAARQIRPAAPEIAPALKQIEQEQRTGVISGKLAAAAAFEGKERWADALKEYRAVLELDSTVVAANEGVARAAPRAALNEQLEVYLTQPERLFSQPVRVAARAAMERASAVPNPGPLLRRQITTLNDWLARADVPVAIALQSDNLTQVTIYRVGALGTFAERSLELAPGSYTVVGTRPGYRDVRRQIDVMPGAAPEPVVIRCEDKI